MANAELCSAEVEGIYETQTPLWFRAMVHLGNMCKPIVPPSGGTYLLDNLKPMDGLKYLEDGTVRNVFLYKYAQVCRVFCVNL